MPIIIKVPKPSGTAYNPQRPLEKNLLIKAQVQHFKEAEKQLPKQLRTKVNVDKIRTEIQASRYIRKITLAIHKSGGIGKRKIGRAA
jgi:hypothetical protein